MKVPFQTNQKKLQNSTPLNTIITYEPKSVLDLRRSPTSGDNSFPKSDSSVLPDAIFVHPDDSPSPQWEEEQILNNLDDLDSLMTELDPQFLPLSHSSFDSALADHQFLSADFSFSADSINSNFINLYSGDFAAHNNNMTTTPTDFDGGFAFLDDLIRAADCIESNELQLANAILARLNLQLPSPAGKPIERAAFYFKQAMQSLLLTESTRPHSISEIVQAMRAYKSFSNVSPVVMFSNFTANQAILEAVDGSMFVHVIDFDIGFGGQWASFMRELVDRAESRKINSPVLRITAVVQEEYRVEPKLIGDSLNQFARELRIGFGIDFVSIRTFDYLSFKSIKLIDGEKTAVVLSPSVFNRTGPCFLDDLRQISPRLVVLVDAEGLTEAAGGPPSFRRRVIDGLEFYSTLLESLEGAGGGGDEDWLRKIETFLLRPKITAAVEAAASRALPWREAFAASGMKPVGFSQFAEFQAEFLLRKVQVRGFHVAKRHAEFVLCWQERALVATSAWRF